MSMNEDGVASALRGVTERDLQRGREVAEAMRVEAEAWKVAQLAATLHSGLSAGGNEILIVDVVKAAFAILAESRRQVAASRPAPEGRPDAG